MEGKENRTSKLCKVCILLGFTLHILCLSYCVFLTTQLTDVYSELADLRSANRIVKPCESEATATPEQVQNSTKGDMTQKERAKRDATSDCGGTFYFSSNSSSPQVYTIQTPNYPQAYPNNQTCEWNFLLEFPETSAYMCGGNRLNEMTLQFSFVGRIDVEDCGCGNFECNYDVLVIRGGSKYGPTVQRYCGDNITLPDVEFDGPMSIKFTSDGGVGRTGFKAEVTAIRRSERISRRKADCAVTEIINPAIPRGSVDITYIRWGAANCPVGQPFYTGYGMGYSNASTPSIICMPFPLELSLNHTSINPANPALTPVVFHSLDPNVLPSQLDRKPVKCALCHDTRTETITVIGWESCNSDNDWQTVYTGFLMTTWSANDAYVSAEPICVDKTLEVATSYGVDPSAPKLTFVQTGIGLWLENKPVPCAVCIKTVK